MKNDLKAIVWLANRAGISKSRIAKAIGHPRTSVIRYIAEYIQLDDSEKWSVFMYSKEISRSEITYGDPTIIERTAADNSTEEETNEIRLD